MNLIASPNNGEYTQTFYWQIEGMTVAIIHISRDGSVEFQGSAHQLKIHNVGNIQERVNLRTTR